MYYWNHTGWGKSFTNKHSLKRHKTTHDPNKKYKWEVCSKSFSLPQYLKEHKVVHTNDRPFVCKFPGCGKSFRQAGKLSIHRKEHSNPQKSQSRARGIKREPDVNLDPLQYQTLLSPQNLSETWALMVALEQNYCLCDQLKNSWDTSDIFTRAYSSYMHVPSLPLTSSMELPNPLNDYYFNVPF